MRLVTEGGHAANGKTSRVAYNVSVDACTLQTSGGEGQLLLIQLIRSTDVRENNLAVDGKDQTLDDLTDLDSDRGRRVQRRFRTVRKSLRLNVQTECFGCLDHSRDIGMDLIAHEDDTVVGPLELRTMAPLSERIAATT